MPPSPLAYSPASVTCFFWPRFGARPEQTVSRGCAINLRGGVTAAVEPAVSATVLFNGKAIEIPTVRHVLRVLAPEPVRVSLESPLPLGCGFGLSAGAALATAFALARRFGLDRSRHDLGMIAHVAEVESRTGIGDVGAQVTGGIVLRRCETGPFDCERLAIAPQPLWFRVFGGLSTRSILTSPSALAQIDREGGAAFAWLQASSSPPSLPALLERSLAFCQGAGLVSDARVAEAIADVERRGGRASMILLGHSVLAVGLPDAADDGWQACSIDPEGTRWL